MLSSLSKWICPQCWPLSLVLHQALTTKGSRSLAILCFLTHSCLRIPQDVPIWIYDTFELGINNDFKKCLKKSFFIFVYFLFSSGFMFEEELLSYSNKHFSFKICTFAFKFLYDIVRLFGQSEQYWVKNQDYLELDKANLNSFIPQWSLKVQTMLITSW